MRLWSIHPKYLDNKGLHALWCEGLLARKVLLGEAKRYKNHPQLERFKSDPEPINTLDAYLLVVGITAQERGIKFDSTKINPQFFMSWVQLTTGQLEYEFNHLLRKLETRSPDKYKELLSVTDPEPHPLFNNVIDGPVMSWERVKSITNE